MCKIYTNFYFDLCDNSKREIVAETVDNRYFSRYNIDITNDNELCGKRYRDFSIQLLPKREQKARFISRLLLFSVLFFLFSALLFTEGF